MTKRPTPAPPPPPEPAEDPIWGDMFGWIRPTPPAASSAEPPPVAPSVKRPVKPRKLKP